MTLPFAYLWCKLVRARGTLSSTQQPAMRGSLFLACFIAGLVGGLATRTRQLVDQSRTYQWGPYITSCYFGPKPFCGDVGDTLIWDKDCNGDGLHDLACVKADGKRELILGQKLSMEAGGHPFCASQPSYFNPVDEPLSFNCPMFAPLSTRSAVARRLQQEFVNSERCTVEECRCSESTFDCGECWRGRSTSLPCWNVEDDGTPVCCRCLVVIAR